MQTPTEIWTNLTHSYLGKRIIAITKIHDNIIDKKKKWIIKMHNWVLWPHILPAEQNNTIFKLLYSYERYSSSP